MYLISVWKPVKKNWLRYPETENGKWSWKSYLLIYFWVLLERRIFRSKKRALNILSNFSAFYLCDFFVKYIKYKKRRNNSWQWGSAFCKRRFFLFFSFFFLFLRNENFDTNNILPSNFFISQNYKYGITQE